MTVQDGDSDMAKQASTLAEYMLKTKYWELKVDIKMT
jgi:hypothetical protein